MRTIITRVLASAAVISLAACGGTSSNGVDTTAYPALVSTTSTTDASQQLSDDIACTQSALTTAAGEDVGFFDCDTTWAILQPTAYSADCTECESVWLYEWTDTAWELRGRCNQYVVLSEASCQPLSGKLTDPTELSAMVAFPPKDVGCAIWDANTWEENVAESGCSADH